MPACLRGPHLSFQTWPSNDSKAQDVSAASALGRLTRLEVDCTANRGAVISEESLVHLSGLSRLEALRLADWGFPYQGAGFGHLTGLRRLRRLALIGIAQFTPDMGANLGYLGSSLRSLELTAERIDPNALPTLVASLPGLRHLSLDPSEMRLLSSDLGTALLPLRHLLSLHLKGYWDSGDDSGYDVALPPTLRRLVLLTTQNALLLRRFTGSLGHTADGRSSRIRSLGIQLFSAAEPFLRALPEMEGLKRLEIIASFPGWTRLDATRLGASLAELGSVQELVLRPYNSHLLQKRQMFMAEVPERCPGISVVALEDPIQLGEL